MNKTEFINTIKDCCNDLVFVYNEKQSGVTAEVADSIPTFQAWHGQETKEYSNVNDVINDKFYSGRSIIELFDSGEVEFSFI